MTGDRGWAGGSPEAPRGGVPPALSGSCRRRFFLLKNALYFLFLIPTFGSPGTPPPPGCPRLPTPPGWVSTRTPLLLGLTKKPVRSAFFDRLCGILFSFHFNTFPMVSIVLYKISKLSKSLETQPKWPFYRRYQLSKFQIIYTFPYPKRPRGLPFFLIQAAVHIFTNFIPADFPRLYPMINQRCPNSLTFRFEPSEFSPSLL